MIDKRVVTAADAVAWIADGATLLISGGHIDMTLLGAFQVSANGDFANWDMMRPERGPLAAVPDCGGVVAS